MDVDAEANLGTATQVRGSAGQAGPPTFSLRQHCSLGLLSPVCPYLLTPLYGYSCGGMLFKMAWVLGKGTSLLFWQIPSHHQARSLSLLEGPDTTGNPPCLNVLRVEASETSRHILFLIDA